MIVTLTPAVSVDPSSLLLYGGCRYDETEGCLGQSGHICRSVQTEIFSMVWETDGMTLFMDPNGMEMFKQAVCGLLSDD